MTDTTPDTVNSPDALKKDPDSMEFFILRDEKVAIAKKRTDVPYHKNRSTYLSSGRYSPKYKKVVFWPDPVNPLRAMKLLEENMHIGSDYTYAIAGSGTQVAKPTKEDGPLDKFDGVRKRQIEVLLSHGGMRIQGHDDSDDQSEETQTQTPSS